jgi:vacuolar-type H+-ATPase subunit C/Vma6
MRYAQVRDMLDQVCDFHGQLAKYYHRLSESSDQQRIKLLLDLMSNHEKQLQESLRDYEEDASKQIMNTWVDCKYCDEVLATCKQKPIVPEASVESVVKATLDIDNCLVQFYREVAEKVESEKLRDVFRNLPQSATIRSCGTTSWPPSWA